MAGPLYMVGGRVAMLDYEKMGLNIKLRRIECGITQYRLAMILGVSQAHLCNVETGRLSLSLKLLVVLRKILKCTLDDLVVEKNQES